MPECYRQAAAGPEPEVPGLEIELSAPNPFQEYQPKADDREKFPSYQEWHGQAWLLRRDKIREAVRGFWGRRLVRFHYGDHIEQEVRSCGKNGGRHFRKLWPTVGPIMQRYAALAWVAAACAPDYVKFAVDLVYTGQDIVKGRGDVKTKSCLLTWIGPWTADLKGEFTTTPGPRQTPVKDITRELTAAVEVVELWRRMQRHGKWVVTKAGAMDWAMCMEICPETYQLQGVIRLHLHVFMKGVNYLRIGALSALALEGATPVSARTVGGLATVSSSAHRASWSGYFYVVAPKSGQLFALSNKRPWKAFLVNPSWTMNLLQSEKLTAAQARQLLCRCSSGVLRNLQELKAIEEERERLLTAEKEQQAIASFRAYRRAFKSYPIVDEFLAQFAHELPRYKFLVLSGPSRLGKTLFARSIAKTDDSLLEVNCSAGNEPDMRAYRLSLHDTILFDEISPKQVASQRKLFQCASAPVTLGTSATNCHSYRVLVYKTKMVLASNVWEGGPSPSFPLRPGLDQQELLPLAAHRANVHRERRSEREA